MQEQFNMSSDSETDFVDHKHTTGSYQEQNEQNLDGKNNPTESAHSTFFENLSSTCNPVGVKNEDIVIFYEDLKRETSEEKSSVHVRLCEVCSQTFSKETDIFKSTSCQTECSCRNENESLFHNIRGQDMTFDAKPPFLDFTTESKLTPLEVQNEPISENEVTKKQDSFALRQRLSVPPRQNNNRMELKICLERLKNGFSLAERKNQSSSCSKSFSKYSNLKVDGHTGKKQLCCKICFKTFGRSNHLRVHGRIHTGEKPFCCNICSRNFAHSHTLKRHKMIHAGGKPFDCKICLKSFRRIDSLKCHRRSHSDDNPLRCGICSKAFTTSSNLRVHERIHTGEKSFLCRICSKSFRQINHLKTHLRTHTGEKPFQCKICTKSFSQRSILKVHERVHNGEKPFCCKICPKTFRQKPHLQEHESGHTGKKTFRCKVCSKAYIRMDSLKHHEKKHADDCLLQNLD